MNNADIIYILSDFFSSVLHEDADSEEYLAELMTMYLLNLQGSERAELHEAIKQLNKLPERQRFDVLDATDFAWALENVEGFFLTCLASLRV